MIVTTTAGVDGHRIAEVCGIVAGDAIFGANVFRDLFAAVRNIVGGRTRGYEKALTEARHQALSRMTEAAEEVGANAVVGINIDTEFVDLKKGGLMMVTAAGTAVVLEQEHAVAQPVATNVVAGSGADRGDDPRLWSGQSLFEDA